MKKTLISLSIIAAVAAIAIGATTAFFSDTEKSTGNTFTAGTIDISVAGQNPWNKTYPMELDKPCETNYINFDIRNVGENSANVWKRINNVATTGGDNHYCGASSEPEYAEGGGTGTPGNCTGSYVERDNLASYMIYDMYICHGAVNSTECPVIGNDPATAQPIYTNPNWIPIIPAANQVRIDNVNGIWIKLDQINTALAKGEKLAVSQSYHLMAWNDAGEETITNWAQGDVMTFDIELEARQLSAPPPGATQMATLQLVEKNTTTWVPVSGGASGALTYKTAGDTFNYSFSATGLHSNENYSLIYYPDPWGSNVTVLSNVMLASGNSIIANNQTIELGSNLPMSGDLNVVGAKIWLVPSSKLGNSAQGSSTTLSWSETGKFLFEMNLIHYTNN